MGDKNKTSTCQASFTDAVQASFTYVKNNMRLPFDAPIYESKPGEGMEKMDGCSGPNIDLKKAVAFSGSLTGMVGGIFTGLVLQVTDKVGLTSPDAPKPEDSLTTSPPSQPPSSGLGPGRSN